MDLIIVGVSKCGTTSLEKYLKDQGHTVLMHQTLATISFGTYFFSQQYKNYKPVLIFRDPIKRDISYKDFQKTKKMKDEYNGLINIEYIISQWLKFDPLIYYLEDLVKIDNFPCLNKSEGL